MGLFDGALCDECEKTEHDHCKTCGYAEGSPACLKYCPHDAERKSESEEV